MGYCKACGKKVIGEGYCPGCYSDKQLQQEAESAHKTLIKFFLKHIIYPLLPVFFLLFIFEKIGDAVVTAHNAYFLANLIQWTGYFLIAILFGWLFKQNIHKGFRGNYWVKVYPYYIGLVLFISLFRFVKLFQGTETTPVKTLVLDIFLLIFILAMIGWLIHVLHKNRKETPRAIEIN
ncbi:MAG: hypothetical protein ACLFQM_04170 [Fidelibacterota bacterium]